MTALLPAGARTGMSKSISHVTLRRAAEEPNAAIERCQRKLQRVLRQNDLTSTDLSGGVGRAETRMSELEKEAVLSPALLGHEAEHADGPLFQCTQCDMIVKESDPYCPFCGAIFADGPLAGLRSDSPQGENTSEGPMVERPAEREPLVRPQKFDVLGLLRHRIRSKELLYQEALRGFPGSARLLEDIEDMVSQIGALGADTSRARRLIGSAWEAARDGDWNLVSVLARQAEQALAPSIPELVRSQIAKARELVLDAKASGVDISSYILRIKEAMQALRNGQVDEALRLTKELMDCLREDSLSWG